LFQANRNVNDEGIEGCILCLIWNIEKRTHMD